MRVRATARLLVPLAMVAASARARAPGRAEEMDVAQSAYKRAYVTLEQARQAYGRALVDAARDPNPYQRHVALERMVKLGWSRDDRAVPALVRMLEETTPLPSETCVEDTPACAKLRSSNGSLAGKLLMNPAANGEILAAVIRRPASVDAIMDSLRERGVATDLLDQLLAATDPAVQVALLRFTLRMYRCDYMPVNHLAPVAALADAADATVRRWAPLVTLRISDCSVIDERFKPIRAAAMAAVAARLQNPGDADVARDAAELGRAAGPLASALAARLEQRPRPPEAERRTLLAAIGGALWKAYPAQAEMLRMLRDSEERALRTEVLQTIASVGSDTPGLSAALLQVAASDPANELPALEALSYATHRISPTDFARFDAVYRKSCAGRPEDLACSRWRRALSHLAESARMNGGPEIDFEPLD